MRNLSVIHGLAVACVLGMLAASPKAWAQEVITPVGTSDEAAAVVVQPDGKIILAGYAVLPTQVDFALVRYHPDLTLDVSFDTDGMVTTDVASGADYARGIALHPDGKIVVAGYATVATEDFAVARYNVDGSLDTSFDTDGIVTTALRSPDRADRGHAVAIQPDGKIVVAGESERSPGNRDFAVVRYNVDGSLDTSFDGDGIALTGLRSPDRSDRAFSLALQSDGKIVVAGYIDDAPNLDVAVVRYNANGSLDTTFDGDGIVTLDLSPNDIAYGVAIQTDGKIVVAGQTQGAFSDILLVRYDTNGVREHRPGTASTKLRPSRFGNRAQRAGPAAERRLSAGRQEGARRARAASLVERNGRATACAAAGRAFVHARTGSRRGQLSWQPRTPLSTGERRCRAQRRGSSFDQRAGTLRSSLLLEAVFHGGHRRLGDAVLAAQSAYADTGAFPELLQIYHLLGDPALMLK